MRCFIPPVRPQLPCLSVESVPADEVDKEERDEEETCIDGIVDNLTLMVRHPSPITLLLLSEKVLRLVSLSTILQLVRPVTYLFPCGSKRGHWELGQFAERLYSVV